MAEILEEKIKGRIEQLKSSREQHQQQLRQYQQAAAQLVQLITGEAGAIAELEKLLEPDETVKE